MTPRSALMPVRLAAYILAIREWSETARSGHAARLGCIEEFLLNCKIMTIHRIWQVHSLMNRGNLKVVRVITARVLERGGGGVYGRGGASHWFIRNAKRQRGERGYHSARGGGQGAPTKAS